MPIIVILLGVTQVLGDSTNSKGKEFDFDWRISTEDHGNNGNLRLAAIIRVQAFNDETLRIKIQNITRKDEFGIRHLFFQQDQVHAPFYVHLKRNQIKSFIVGKDEISGIVDIKKKFLSTLARVLEFQDINGPVGWKYNDSNHGELEELEIIRASDVTKMLPIPFPAKEEVPFALQSGGLNALSGNSVTSKSDITEFQQEKGKN